jgi:error-prone DNA polymerase
MSYAELHCISNFTFLRGASHPEELVERANDLGYAGLALTDECSLAGVVRAHGAAKELPLRLVVGSEFRVAETFKVVVLARDRQSYGALSHLISLARMDARKGEYHIDGERMAAELCASSCLVLWVPGIDQNPAEGGWLKERFDGRLWLAVEYSSRGSVKNTFAAACTLAKALALPMVASGNVHMHVRKRRVVQDTVTAIRLGKPLSRSGFALHPNGERYLRTIEALERIYPRALLDESIAILERIEFSLDELRYEYPRELVPEGTTPSRYLRGLTEAGMRWRWPNGIPARVVALVEHELALIAELGYEPYFLTVYDIVQFARREGILCQGRGSAANSAVCYCLGITEVDPARMEMLVERFISRERKEPPDIDVDFEHERREEVIQYIYRKYSRRRAALAATVITYRPRSAIRDVGKALGLNEAQIAALATSLQWWDGSEIARERIEEAGLDPGSPAVERLMYLVEELLGFPRHLSQHVGGFVIAQDELTRLVPIENAAMPERTVIQWDKDDLETLGLLKIDVLGLGMLTAIRRSLDLINGFYGSRLTLASVPREDPVVYDMIARADTMGVFQIESRAQMAMLPRLKPRCYYDLVIEVAIIRPGPIQGDMVHPYLRRRNKEEPVTYPSAAVRKVLERTLGVPIFQEQVMQLAIVAAGFTPGEADQLRRAMAAWRRRGDVERFRERLLTGMLQRGYAQRFAEQIFDQIRGFGEYGFPESHAASFALLAYISAWLKCHEPAAYFCALLNSQPMGFYAPAQLLRCAARHHEVEVLQVDVVHSQWDSSLVADARGRPGIRLGLRMINGLGAEAGARIVAARSGQAFTSVRDLARRARLNRKEIGVLAAADALRHFAANRHQARWQAAGIEPSVPLFDGVHSPEPMPLLPVPTEGENVVADYRYLGTSLRAHPIALVRSRLSTVGVVTADVLAGLKHGIRVKVAGLVVTRQRPASAAGVTFVTLEDETGYVNLIVWERVAMRDRRHLLGSVLLECDGKVQKEGDVIHVVAASLRDRSDFLGELTIRSRNFQ